MTRSPTRRTVVTGIGAVAAGIGFSSRRGEAQSMSSNPDLILFNGKITTLDRQNPEAQAIAVKDGHFTVAGSDHEVMALAGADTKRIDVRGRRVIPGLIDNHMHIIRGGLNYNMELRWDGVRSLAYSMGMM
jgi:predicted amidohydrolase YtcJ